jgi:hypothetical protein
MEHTEQPTICKHPDAEKYLESILDRARAVDEMLYERESNQRNSPYVTRRDAQIALLKEAWGHIWTGHLELTRREAKDLLIAAGNDTEEVLEQAAHCASKEGKVHQKTGEIIQIDSPAAYVLDALKNREKDGQAVLEPPMKGVPALPAPRVTVTEVTPDMHNGRATRPPEDIPF